MVWCGLTKFAQARKKGEHVYVSGELRYREHKKKVGKGKDTVKMPVAEIHGGEIQRLIRKPQKMVRRYTAPPSNALPRRRDSSPTSLLCAGRVPPDLYAVFCWTLRPHCNSHKA